MTPTTGLPRSETLNGSIRQPRGCGGAAWTGEGTDGAGVIRLQNNVTISNTATVTFTYLGAAAPGGTYRVRNPIDGTTLFVCVATTGRVRVQPSTAATPSSTCP